MTTTPKKTIKLKIVNKVIKRMTKKMKKMTKMKKLKKMIKINRKMISKISQR